MGDRQDCGNNEGKVRFPSRWYQTRTSYCCLYPDLRKVERPKSDSDLAISAHLTTEAEIDEFVDDALAELEQVRIDAKKELAAA